MAAAGQTDTRVRAELKPGIRVLMGPGPSDVDPRVLRAMATPLVGHLDPDFLQIMNDTQQLLRATFRTENQLTLAMSGTGSAGMETCLVNLIEPGDRVVVCVNGLFGQRLADIAGRCGAEVVQVEAEWGRIIEPQAVEAELRRGACKLVAVVHAETSTGVLQPVEEIIQAAARYGALTVVDTVTSLGGADVAIDRWGADAAYSGTQKCLSCPPGLAPVTFGERARAALRARRGKVQSWYLDLNMIENYWGQERFYHHTAPISMVYALREALRIVHEEGLDARLARHAGLGAALQEGLEAMGLRLVAQAGYRAPMLTSVEIPPGVDDLAVRRRLLADYGVEIGGGLGPLKGRIWRIGLMGHACRLSNVTLFLAGLGHILRDQGFAADTAAALAAARARLAAAGAG